MLRLVWSVLGLTILLAACSPAPSGTSGKGTTPPGATGSVEAGPTAASPTPGGSSTTSPRASSSASPGSTSGGGDGREASKQIVLRMEQGGGLVPMGSAATQLPQFTLYRDGTVIYRGGRDDPVAAGPNAPLAPLRVATMNEEQIEALVRFALGPGRLHDARPRYENMTVADAPTTVFSIDAGGVTKSVSIYGLGINDERSPERAELAGFADLARILGDFEKQVQQGNATDAGSYEPDRYRAVLMESAPGDRDVAEWPWEGMTLDDFRDTGGGVRTAVLTRRQAAESYPEGAGGHTGIVVRGPDGNRYTVALRPLLPDEES